jgi:hypothetical protein
VGKIAKARARDDETVIASLAFMPDDRFARVNAGRSLRSR